MSFVTTEPAPIVTFFPIFTFGKIVEFVPINVNAPIVQLPETLTSGQSSTKSSMIQS